MRESDREGRIMIKVIKKDGTKEEFNVQKVVVAVNKSAYRALVTFTEEELDFICNFVTEKVEQMRKKEVTISDMHNVVEGALEQTNPLVAKSYRDYRNYKQDFVQMLDEVYKKSQSIMYIGDKENSNTDSALVSNANSPSSAKDLWLYNCCNSFNAVIPKEAVALFKIGLILS